MQASHYRPTFLFAPLKAGDSLPVSGLEYGGLAQNLPENVHILTLEPIREYQVISINMRIKDIFHAQIDALQVLLRLEHLFAPDEHPLLSQDAQVDLADMFSTINIYAIEETTLGGNIPLSKVRNLFSILYKPNCLNLYVLVGEAALEY